METHPLYGNLRRIKKSSRVVQVLRHLPEIRERDGALLWTTLVKECSKGFHETVTWIFDEWKKRNLDDTAAEILHEKEQLEDKEVRRVILKESPAAKGGEASISKQRISMRLKPDIEQRFDGISQEAIEEDQEKQTLASTLVKRKMESANKKELMGEWFPQDGVKIHTNQ